MKKTKTMNRQLHKKTSNKNRISRMHNNHNFKFFEFKKKLFKNTNEKRMRI